MAMWWVCVVLLVLQQTLARPQESVDAVALRPGNSNNNNNNNNKPVISVSEDGDDDKNLPGRRPVNRPDDRFDREDNSSEEESCESDESRENNWRPSRPERPDQRPERPDDQECSGDGEVEQTTLPF